MFMLMCMVLGSSKTWPEKFLTAVVSNQCRNTQLYKMLTKVTVAVEE